MATDLEHPSLVRAFVNLVNSYRRFVLGHSTFEERHSSRRNLLGFYHRRSLTAPGLQYQMLGMREVIGQLSREILWAHNNCLHEGANVNHLPMVRQPRRRPSLIQG